MKAEAGVTACAFVESGMKIGIGTGSTVKYTILELGRRIREEGLEITGIPTSKATEILSKQQGIPMINWDECDSLDLVIDGADEFDQNLHLIKGGGGALLREKIVAESSAAMIVVADASKKVEILGNFPLPIEVNPYGWEQTKRRVEKLCPGHVVRRGPDYLTDNGNPILDANFGASISDPVELEAEIRAISGVVDVGLFTDTADVVVMAAIDGCVLIRKENARI
tara:strand:+ start:539 stop:1213 length:675 start_codon:yes stop_codon:yes gene_type:complete